MLLAQLTEQEQGLVSVPVGAEHGSALLRAATMPDSVQRDTGAQKLPKEHSVRHRHQTNGVQTQQNAVDVVLRALVQNAPEELSGQPLVAVASTRFVAMVNADKRNHATNGSSSEEGGWLRVAHRIIPNFSPAECALSFVLPVGFYESREMRIELVPIPQACLQQILGETETTGSPNNFNALLHASAPPVVAATCGFAEMRLADEAILKYDEVSSSLREREERSSTSSAKLCCTSFSVQDVVRSESCVRLSLAARVLKRRLWPHEGGPTLFWVLFRQEDHGNRWTALYRSEVRSTRDIFGEFRFLQLAIDRYALNDYTPSRVLRVEFFQFRAPPAPPALLACSEFTERDLRTAEPGAELPLHVNMAPAAPNTLFEGTFSVKSTSHASSESPHYRLNARFTSSPLARSSSLARTTSRSLQTIFLDVSASVQARDWPYGAPRVALTIRRLSTAALTASNSARQQSLSSPPVGTFSASAAEEDDLVYKSEVVRPEKADGFARFKLIKLTAADLGNAPDPVLRVEWFHHRVGAASSGVRSLGCIELSRQSIVTVAPGSLLPFHPPNPKALVKGTVRVQQAEDLSDKSFFALYAEFACAPSAKAMRRSSTR